ncbi:hypothetical protein D3D02_04210 [Halobellus sp. Atlit-38R]|nr:hypothetical protein D3D02_04210 [Halobellus sp. Atlit-38R]
MVAGSNPVALVATAERSEACRTVPQGIRTTKADDCRYRRESSLIRQSRDVGTALKIRPDCN